MFVSVLFKPGEIADAILVINVKGGVKSFVD
jgi:hypothetical protein